jgi:hypothetical protein
MEDSWVVLFDCTRSTERGATLVKAQLFAAVNVVALVVALISFGPRNPAAQGKRNRKT